MATLGKNWSQQLGFTVTTAAGTVYTHGLGFTPTVVILTGFGSGTTPGVVNLAYTAADTNVITICAGAVCKADVTVGRFHSLIK